METVFKIISIIVVSIVIIYVVLLIIESIKDRNEV